MSIIFTSRSVFNGKLYLRPSDENKGNKSTVTVICDSVKNNEYVL